MARKHQIGGHYGRQISGQTLEKRMNHRLYGLTDDELTRAVEFAEDPASSRQTEPAGEISMGTGPDIDALLVGLDETGAVEAPTTKPPIEFGAFGDAPEPAKFDADQIFEALDQLLDQLDLSDRELWKYKDVREALTRKTAETLLPHYNSQARPISPEQRRQIGEVIAIYRDGEERHRAREQKFNAVAAEARGRIKNKEQRARKARNSADYRARQRELSPPIPSAFSHASLRRHTAAFTAWLTTPGPLQAQLRSRAQQIMRCWFVREEFRATMRREPSQAEFAAAFTRRFPHHPMSRKQAQNRLGLLKSLDTAAWSAR